MSISALSAGASGISANIRALDLGGQNIANAVTPGFQAASPSFQESSPAGGGVSLSTPGRALSGGASGVDLATEISNSLIYKAGVDLSAKVIKSADATLGSLIDISA
ncbi:MAG TPA: hypothetical protein DCW29_24060 [Janthinobacterium sp.]|nr:hypothetical protein [Janthinobacterium sp.]